VGLIKGGTAATHRHVPLKEEVNVAEKDTYNDGGRNRTGEENWRRVVLCDVMHRVFYMGYKKKEKVAGK
jgi:hypothetical protein